jgi:hypothetical protein
MHTSLFTILPEVPGAEQLLAARQPLGQSNWPAQGNRAVTSCTTAPRPRGCGVTPEEWAAAAALAIERLDEDQGAGELLREHGDEARPPRGEPARYAHLWPYSQVVMAGLLLAGGQPRAATADFAVSQRLAALEGYWSPQAGGYLPVAESPGPASGDLYYDDNAWVGLALLQWFTLTSERPALVRAGQVFSLLARAWDRDPAKPSPGGIPWTRAPGHDSRNTCSNGPAAELGAGLYLVTGERRYLEWAKALERWTSDTLVDRDGLYADHLAPDGSVDPTRWSYNQGSMVAANALLYRADRDPEHLGRARDVAAASLAHYGEGRLMAQPPVFNAIFTRGLLALHATRPDDSLLRPLLGYAEDLYRAQIDRSSGRVTGGAQVPSVLLQAGVISVLALAAWPASRYHLLV